MFTSKQNKKSNKFGILDNSLKSKSNRYQKIKIRLRSEGKYTNRLMNE